VGVPQCSTCGSITGQIIEQIGASVSDTWILDSGVYILLSIFRILPLRKHSRRLVAARPVRVPVMREKKHSDLPGDRRELALHLDRGPVTRRRGAAVF
jgi:hypothetical protein